MADNYLEKRYEAVFGRDAGRNARAQRPSLDRLLLANRSYRIYDKSYKVDRRQLEAMIAVNPRVGSAMNRQALRFYPVTAGPEAGKILSLIRMGAAVPDIKLPPEGREPEAFIVICSTLPETAVIDIDLGISAQSMLLKAAEMGLGGIFIRNFNARALREALGLELRPLAVIAVGKPDETIELVPAAPGEGLAYYFRDGIHYVPKLSAKDLIIHKKSPEP